MPNAYCAYGKIRNFIKSSSCNSLLWLVNHLLNRHRLWCVVRAVATRHLTWLLSNVQQQTSCTGSGNATTVRFCWHKPSKKTHAIRINLDVFRPEFASLCFPWKTIDSRDCSACPSPRPFMNNFMQVPLPVRQRRPTAAVERTLSATRTAPGHFSKLCRWRRSRSSSSAGRWCRSTVQVANSKAQDLILYRQ